MRPPKVTEYVHNDVQVQSQPVNELLCLPNRQYPCGPSHSPSHSTSFSKALIYISESSGPCSANPSWATSWYVFLGGWH